VPVFNRVVELRDTYREGRGGKPAAPVAARQAPSTAREEKAPGRAGTVSEERARARAADAMLAQRYDSYVRDLGLPPALADVLTGDAAVAEFFDAARAAYPNPRAVANWMANDVLRELKGRSIADLPFTAAQLADLVRRVEAREVTSAAARTVFAHMLTEGGSPEEIIGRLGLEKAYPEAELAAAVDEALAAMPDKVQAYRAGKVSLLGLFTGQVMKATQGKADPVKVQELIRSRLE